MRALQRMVTFWAGRGVVAAVALLIEYLALCALARNPVAMVVDSSPRHG